jgi:hypothetical protein
MDFTFEHSHFNMDTRESFRAMKNLAALSPPLLDFVVSELKNGNVISSVLLFGDNEIQVVFRNPFHKVYDNAGVSFTRETDPHYHGDFYRAGSHSLVAPF